MRYSVLSYLENTVLHFPDKIAVTDTKEALTFRELKRRAQIVARVLREKDAALARNGSVSGKTGNYNTPILVYVEKSVHSIVCFMSALYSGHFYTPTDVEFPFAKVQGVLNRLEPEWFLTNDKNEAKLLDNGISPDRIVNIDRILSEFGDDETGVSDKERDITESTEGNISPDSQCQMTYPGIDTDLVYCLFTSGSTGVPKGVGITHRSIIDYIDWARECYSIDETHTIGNQAPFYFDNSTLDIYLCLSTGATLHIIPKSYYTFPAKLVQYMHEQKIDTIFWVPSMLINVANFDLLSAVDLSFMRKILFAGEVMPNKQLNYWRAHIPNALYSNLYGPTEITVDCTYYTVDREFTDDEPLPIGIPCRNSDILVLDEDNRRILPEERNVIGELCVRGSSLAVGYYNDPVKTEEVFTQNPLNPHYPERIYRTGDLVSFNEHGEIMFVGRKDFQIKHMGNRIELGEIETAALGFSALENVCVLYDQEQKQIVLFYQGTAEDSEVKKYLMGILPKYMIPAVYYRLDAFPYNDNGKIDRKHLKTAYLDNQ